MTTSTRWDTIAPRAVDLFSGAGGVTCGYKLAGVKVIGAADNDRNSRATYAQNHPEVLLLDWDLGTCSPPDLLRELQLRPGELDILTACAPCQTFSSLGQSERRARDPRNNLITRIPQFVNALAPKALVLENVPRLEPDTRFKGLVAELRIAGYGVWHGIVDAASFGVPQRRRRLVLLALRGCRDEDVPALEPNHEALLHLNSAKTVRDAFHVLDASTADPLHRPRTKYPDTVARRIAAIPRDGGSRSSLPEHLRLACHRRLRDRNVNGSGSVYGRMKWDEVSPTLTTRCTTPACGRYLHPSEDRAITLREAAVLQSFPLEYQFSGGVMSIQSQIGNAVPPRLAQAIASLVMTELRR